MFDVTILREDFLREEQNKISYIISYIIIYFYNLYFTYINYFIIIKNSRTNDNIVYVELNEIILLIRIY